MVGKRPSDACGKRPLGATGLPMENVHSANQCPAPQGVPGNVTTTKDGRAHGWENVPVTLQENVLRRHGFACGKCPLGKPTPGTPGGAGQCDNDHGWSRTRVGECPSAASGERPPASTGKPRENVPRQTQAGRPRGRRPNGHNRWLHRHNGARENVPSKKARRTCRGAGERPGAAPADQEDLNAWTAA